jgi:hypothetical protein
MGDVHNHPPYEPPCNETIRDGKLIGYCMWPDKDFKTLQPDDIIAPGAFAKMEGLKVPVKFLGETVGQAEISADGDIITVELKDGTLHQLLKFSLREGLADGISIRPNYVPSTPRH